MSIKSDAVDAAHIDVENHELVLSTVELGHGVGGFSRTTKMNDPSL